MYLVIIADDVGDKLWPVTMPELPKGLLPVYSSKSQLQETIERCFAFLERGGDDIIIVIPEAAIDMLVLTGVMEQYMIPIDNVITTPCYKGSAYSLLAAMKVIEEKGADPNELIIVSPSDQFFFPTTSFILYFKNLLLESVSHKECLTILSLSPSAAVTTLNYLKYDSTEETSLLEAISNNITDKFTRLPSISVDDYKVEPDVEEASELIQNGWLWDISTYASSYSKLRDIFSIPHGNKDLDSLMSQWKGIVNLDIGQAIYKGNFGNDLRASIIPQMAWSVLDNWIAVKNLLYNSGIYEQEPVQGLHCIESDDNLVFKPTYKEVALYGINDLIIIDTGEKLLIATPGALYENF